MYAAAAIVLAVVVFVPLSSLTLKGKSVVRGIMAPAERSTSSVWRHISEAAAAIRGIGGALEENRELSRELVRTQARLSSLLDVEEECKRLQDALDFYQKQPSEIIPCDVVSRDISGWWNTVRIGKGSRAGIGPGQAVISPDGLVGKTTEVTPYTAEVLLITDRACQISAKIKRTEDDERDDIFGLVSGAGNTLDGKPSAKIDFINKNETIRVNDEVVTSGLGAFPKGVHVGYITEVETDESGLFQSAVILPRATVGLLDYVFVVPTSTREVAE